MANHGAAGALLIMASLLAAAAGLGDARTMVAVQRDDARPRPVTLPLPELVCNAVHAVNAGETCFSVAEGGRLTQEQFLSFNPNINCAKVFVGQWVCLDAFAPG